MSSHVLTLSYVVHVASALLWVGSVLYAAAVLPTVAGGLGDTGVARAVDGVLQVTRWTGVLLPATGAYQVWALYPVDALLGTTRGYLVLGMAALWGLMNGVLEVGAYRARAADRRSLARHFLRPFRPADVGGDGTAVAATLRPYVLVAALLAVLLVADAAVLAAGVP